jgi:hypothetical protein
MGEQSAKLCENCSRSYWAFGLSQPILICNKKQGSDGKHFVIEPMACCTNYRRGRKPRNSRRHTSHKNDGAKFIPLVYGGFAIVDADDYERLVKYKWYCYYLGSSSYAYRTVGNTRILMHREILNAPKGMVVDHKDGNGLNNRKRNLRLCTPTQNLLNRRPTLGSSSKYKGVCRDKSRRRWLARIGFNNKDIHLGRFDNEIEAAKAYDRMAKKLFGEFAYLNFPK